jgi:hypothetical protein
MSNPAEVFVELYRWLHEPHKLGDHYTADFGHGITLCVMIATPRRDKDLFFVAWDNGITVDQDHMSGGVVLQLALEHHDLAIRMEADKEANSV